MKIIQECDKMIKHQIKIKIETQTKSTEGRLEETKAMHIYHL